MAKKPCTFHYGGLAFKEADFRTLILGDLMQEKVMLDMASKVMGIKVGSVTPMTAMAMLGRDYAEFEKSIKAKQFKGYMKDLGWTAEKTQDMLSRWWLMNQDSEKVAVPESAELKAIESPTEDQLQALYKIPPAILKDGVVYKVHGRINRRDLPASVFIEAFLDKQAKTTKEALLKKHNVETTAELALKAYNNEFTIDEFVEFLEKKILPLAGSEKKGSLKITKDTNLAFLTRMFIPGVTGLTSKHKDLQLKIAEVRKSLTKTEDYYIQYPNTPEAQEYQRVTRWLKGEANLAGYERSSERGDTIERYLKIFYQDPLQYALQESEMSDVTKRFIQKVTDLIKSKNLQFVATDVNVLGTALQYGTGNPADIGGELDFLFMNEKGEFVVLDIKSIVQNTYQNRVVAKGLSEKEYAQKQHDEQLTTYRKLLQSTYGLKVPIKMAVVLVQTPGNTKAEIRTVAETADYYLDESRINYHEIDINFDRNTWFSHIPDPVANPLPSSETVPQSIPQTQDPEKGINPANAAGVGSVPHEPLPDNIEFMTSDVPQVTRSAEEEAKMEVFRKWFNTAFPEFTIIEDDPFLEELYSLYNQGEQAVGAMFNGAVILGSYSPAVAGYHEAGHLAQHFLLTPAQQKALVEEKRKALPNSDQLTDRQVFEQIMLDFNESVERFQQDGVSTTPMGRFFQKLQRFIERLLNLMSGRYKNPYTLKDFNYSLYHNYIGRNILGKRDKTLARKIKRDIEALKPPVEFMAYGDYSQNIRSAERRFMYEVVTAFNNYWIPHILRTQYRGRSLYEVLTSRVDKTSIQYIYRQVEGSLINLINTLRERPDIRPVEIELWKKIRETLFTTTFNEEGVLYTKLNEDNQLFRQLLAHLRTSHGVTFGFTKEGARLLLGYDKDFNLDKATAEDQLPEPVTDDAMQEPEELDELGQDEQDEDHQSDEEDETTDFQQYKANVTNKKLDIVKLFSYLINSSLSSIPEIEYIHVSHLRDMHPNQNMLSTELITASPSRNADGTVNQTSDNPMDVLLESFKYALNRYGLPKFPSDLNTRKDILVNSIHSAKTPEEMMNKMLLASSKDLAHGFLYVLHDMASRNKTLKSQLFKIAQTFPLEAWSVNIGGRKTNNISRLNVKNDWELIMRTLLKGYLNPETNTYENPKLTKDQLEDLKERLTKKIVNLQDYQNLLKDLHLNIDEAYLRLITTPENESTFKDHLIELIKLMIRGNEVVTIHTSESRIALIAKFIASNNPGGYTLDYLSGRNTRNSTFKRFNQILDVWTAIKESMVGMSSFVTDLLEKNGFYKWSPLLQRMVTGDGNTFSYGEITEYTIRGNRKAIKDLTDTETRLLPVSLYFADKNTGTHILDQHLDSDILYAFSLRKYEDGKQGMLPEPLVLDYAKAIMQEISFLRMALDPEMGYQQHLQVDPKNIGFRWFPLFNSFIEDSDPDIELTLHQKLENLNILYKTLEEAVSSYNPQGGIKLDRYYKGLIYQHVWKNFNGYVKNLVDQGMLGNLLEDPRMTSEKNQNVQMLPFRIGEIADGAVIDVDNDPRLPLTIYDGGKPFMPLFLNNELTQILNTAEDKRDQRITNNDHRGEELAGQVPKHMAYMHKLFSFYAQDLLVREQMLTLFQIHPLFSAKMEARSAGPHSPADIGNLENLPEEMRYAAIPILQIADIEVQYDGTSAALVRDNPVMRDNFPVNEESLSSGKATDSQMLSLVEGYAKYLALHAGMSYEEAYQYVSKNGLMGHKKPFISTAGHNALSMADPATGREVFWPLPTIIKTGTDFFGFADTNYATKTIDEYLVSVAGVAVEDLEEARKNLPKYVSKGILQLLTPDKAASSTVVRLDKNVMKLFKDDRVFAIYKHPTKAMMQHLVDTNKAANKLPIEHIMAISAKKFGGVSSQVTLDFSKITKEQWQMSIENPNQFYAEVIAPAMDYSLRPLDIRDQVAVKEDPSTKSADMVYQFKTLMYSVFTIFEDSSNPANKKAAYRMANEIIEIMGKSIEVKFQRFREQYPTTADLLDKVKQDLVNAAHTQESLLQYVSQNPLQRGPMLPIWHNQIRPAMTQRMMALYDEILKMPAFGPILKNVTSFSGLGGYVKKNGRFVFDSGARQDRKMSAQRTEDLQVVYGKDAQGNTIIKYAEARVPLIGVYRDIYRLMEGRSPEEKTKNLLTFLQENNLDMFVGNRVPLEQWYSTFPMKIVGFTTDRRSNVIEMPVEWMKTGGDQDSDSWYTMYPAIEYLRNKSKLGTDDIPYRRAGSNADDFMGRHNKFLDNVIAIMQMPEMVSHIMLKGESLSAEEMYVEGAKKVSTDIVENNRAGVNDVFDRRSEITTGEGYIGAEALTNNIVNMVGSNPSLSMPLNAKHQVALFSKHATNLYPPQTISKERSLSLQTAHLVGTSVDNAKTPKLAKMGYRKSNKNINIVMQTFGFDTSEIKDFINSDVVKEYFSYAKYVSKSSVLKFMRERHGENSKEVTALLELMRDQEAYKFVELAPIDGNISVRTKNDSSIQVSEETALLVKLLYFSNVVKELTGLREVIRLTKQGISKESKMIKIRQFVNNYGSRKGDRPGTMGDPEKEGIADYSGILPVVIENGGEITYDFSNIKDAWLRNALQAYLTEMNALSDVLPSLGKKFTDVVSFLEDSNKVTLSEAQLTFLNKVFIGKSMYEAIAVEGGTEAYKDPLKVLKMVEALQNMLFQVTNAEYEGTGKEKGIDEIWPVTSLYEIEFTPEMEARAGLFPYGTVVLHWEKGTPRAFATAEFVRQPENRGILIPKGGAFNLKVPGDWWNFTQFIDYDLMNMLKPFTAEEQAAWQKDPGKFVTAEIIELLRVLNGYIMVGNTPTLVKNHIYKTRAALQSVNNKVTVMHKGLGGPRLNTYKVYNSSGLTDRAIDIKKEYQEAFYFMISHENKWLSSFAKGLLFTDFYSNLHAPAKNSLFYMIDPNIFYRDFMMTSANGIPRTWFDRTEDVINGIFPSVITNFVSRTYPEKFVRFVNEAELGKAYEYEGENTVITGAKPVVYFTLANAGEATEKQDNLYPEYLKYQGPSDNNWRLYEHIDQGIYVISEKQHGASIHNLSEIPLYDPTLTNAEAVMAEAADIINRVNNGLQNEDAITVFTKLAENKKLKLKPCK